MRFGYLGADVVAGGRYIHFGHRLDPAAFIFKRFVSLIDGADKGKMRIGLNYLLCDLLGELVGLPKKAGAPDAGVGKRQFEGVTAILKILTVIIECGGAFGLLILVMDHRRGPWARVPSADSIAGHAGYLAPILKRYELEGVDAAIG